MASDDPNAWLAARIRQARRVTVLTGAGVSAASGVPTFRGAGGLWNRLRPEDLATPEAFTRNPQLVWEWYAWRRQQVAACRPNPAHEVLARWSRQLPDCRVITQNVDDLHLVAGTNRLIRLHGSLWELCCLAGCAGGGARWRDEDTKTSSLRICPRCGGVARPGVVWFGEALDADVVDEAVDATTCDVFIAVGTSAIVYPAAGLLQQAESRGAVTAEINPEATPASAVVDVAIQGPAERVLPELDRLLDVDPHVPGNIRSMHNPFVPESLEGWSLLHLMFRVRWDRVRGQSPADIDRVATEAVAALVAPDAGPTAFVQMLGHKADLMIVGFRRGFEPLADLQLRLARTGLFDWLELTTSYVSIVELGMYEMTAKIHEQLGAKFEPGSAEFERAFDAEMETQRQRVTSRLFLELPKWRNVCFYPMNKRRGETVNWYSESFERRASMMREHGMIGRHYSGRVIQIISGSIGYDDWEWGVDLFAEDPLVFKKLIYEMRFDEASAKFAEFGPFYTGLQFAPEQLGALLAGRVPSL